MYISVAAIPHPNNTNAYRRRQERTAPCVDSFAVTESTKLQGLVHVKSSGHNWKGGAAHFERSRDVVQMCTYLWDPSPHAARYPETRQPYDQRRTPTRRIR
jgi:hypothetical protein